MISVIKGDITRLDFDLIVNDARSDLMPQDGICSKIFSVGKDDLLKECEKIHFCEEGQVVLTHACNLPCKGILHAVGPKYLDGNQNEEEILEACYWNALAFAYKLTRETGWKSLSIAFSDIGIQNGYPRKEACKVAVNTIKKLFKEYPESAFIHVVFVCEKQIDYMNYKEELNK